MGMILYLRRTGEAEARTAAEDADGFADYLFDESAEAGGDLVDFDKAWGALHFMFSGSPWAGDGPLAFLLAPWPEVGADMGYGPPRLAPPEAVRAFRDALAELTDADLKLRYNPAAMAREDVYIADSLVDEGEEGWEYVAQGLPALRRFLDRCVDTGSSALIVLS
jgi:hypothetical protein